MAAVTLYHVNISKIQEGKGGGGAPSAPPLNPPMAKNILPEVSIVKFGSYFQFSHRTYQITDAGEHEVNLIIYVRQFGHKRAVLLLNFKFFKFVNELLEDKKFFRYFV